MPTMNSWVRGEWTTLGSDGEIGSLTAPAQETYTNPIVDIGGSVATATATQIFGSTSPGLSDVSTWSTGWITCSADFRLGFRGSSDANSAVFTFRAGTYRIPNYQIPTYDATFATYIAGALVSTTQIWIYQSSGSAATWRLVLGD